jgi:hypothetical protein
MLYNEELEAREEKKPSDTSVFGTNILLTLGVTIVGKDISRWFRPFRSLDELIRFKAGMRKPPAGNVPITITKYDNPEITATVVDDRNVEYNGEIMSLTALAKLLSGKKYSIAGPKFFKYKGEWLNDIRHRLGV